MNRDAASSPDRGWRGKDALVISGSDWQTEELARTGSPPPGHGRCSFDTHRGTPASHTSEPGRGAMQGFRAVRTTRTGGARSRATAPMRARPRAGRASLAGTAPRATPRSACCRTFSRPGCREPWTSSRRWWHTRSGPRVRIFIRDPGMRQKRSTRSISSQRASRASLPLVAVRMMNANARQSLFERAPGPDSRSRTNCSPPSAGSRDQAWRGGSPLRLQTNRTLIHPPCWGLAQSSAPQPRCSHDGNRAELGIRPRFPSRPVEAPARR